MVAWIIAVLLINFGSDSRSKVCQEKRNTFLGQFSPYFFNSCDKTLTISQLPQQLHWCQFIIATSLFLDLKWQFSGGNPATPTSFSLFDSYDMKSLWFKFGHDIFAGCYFEASEDIITRFKSQALNIMKSKYWKVSGSGNPPSLPHSRPPENCLFRSKNRLVAII